MSALKKITVLALLHCAIFSFAQLDTSQPLPETQKIIKGTLPNGMTYYLCHTDVIKSVASYYIIQNVGSVLEHDDQQGLAHFLEHMAFNGTKNFEGKGILNTLQKQGIVFGKDINAYTSFDETVYNINNIPTTPELIDTGLLILRDWSNDLLLTDEEIDAERGVIKEEWRTRQNGNMRILKQSLPIMFNHTIYAQRMPIGLMDVIDNFDYKVLRDFYHDWYRTDLQAIAIVGDFDVDNMEQKIKALFSDISAVENPKERVLVTIPDNDIMQYGLAMDDEVTTANIGFGIRHPKKLETETVADLKASLLNYMAVSMLSARYDEIKRQPDAPFLGVRLNFGDHSRTSNALTCMVYPKQDQQQEAFKTALTELARAVKFGFTQNEMERTIAKFMTFYENAISKEDDQSHKQIVSTIQNNFLEQATMTDVTKEYDLAKQIFETLQADDLHSAIKELYTKKNRYLMVTGVKGQNNLTEHEALEIFDEVENKSVLEPYTDALSGKTLMGDVVIEPGFIVSEYTYQPLNASTFSLSNGVKVHYKFTDKNKNDVQFKAISKGGLSLLEDDDLPSANLVQNVVDFSGLGDYSATDLKKILAGKTVSTSVNISNLFESITGSSTTTDIETLLQMVYLSFEKPRFDPDGFQVLMGNVDNYIVRKSKDINQRINDSTTVALYGKDNPKHRVFDEAYAKDIALEKVKDIYLDRFANPADFEFFIVGDINKEALKPLLEKYLASMPTTTALENWETYPVSWVNDSINKEVSFKMEDPKCTVKIAYKNDVEYSLKNEYLANAIGDILKLRYTETLREQEGGTYGANVSAELSKRPVPKGEITVVFDCNPDKVETLINVVHQEINKLAQGDIKQEDLDKTLTNYLKERQQEKDFNRYEMGLLTDYVIEGFNRNDPTNFEDIIYAITVKDIQQFAKRLLDGADSYQLVFKPSSDQTD